MILLNKFKSINFISWQFANKFQTDKKEIKKGMMIIELKKIEEGLIPIYENESRERLINARELHKELGNKRRFADCIKQRIEQYGFIENEEFIKHHNFVTVGNLKRPQLDYFLTIDMSKELCMVANNEKGRFIRRYFIETEKRYREIINTNSNSNQLIDLMQNAIKYKDS